MKPLIRRWKSIVTVLTVGCGALAAAAAPFSAFTYQGRLDAEGSAANGNYDVRFALFTSSGGGSAVAVVTNLNVAVSNGLFTTLVDFGAAVFDGTPYWLELAVRTNGGGGFSVLSPRQDLTAAPYAIYASKAGQASGVAPGTVSLAGLNTNSVDTRYVLKSGDTMSGALTAPSLRGSSFVTTPSLIGSNSLAIRSGGDIEFIIDANNNPGLLGFFEVFNATSHIFWVNEAGNARVYGDFIADGKVTANSIDLGSPSVNGTLNVYRTAANTPAISLFGNLSQISTYGSDGLEQIRLWGPSYGELLLRNSSPSNQLAVTLSANGISGGYLSLYNSNGLVRARLRGLNAGGDLTLYTADGGTGLYLAGDSGGAGLINIYNTNSSVRVLLDGQSTGGGGEISVRDADGTETIEILGAETADTGGQILMRNASGVNTIQIDSDANGNGSGYISLYKANGTATIRLEADIGGNGRITTQELQITGGSDLSEQFDIRAAEGAPLPGMVVCIDPLRPGELVVSSKAYDRTVAGVISGAGGVKPGMLMGQAGTKADGKYPVALSGRVYCLADAAHGPIQPGDLLTTSDTPGHAMKVRDPTRAQGAIIGKAMTGLPSGRGLVLVLVALQ
jgi:hypothetical protein